MTPEQIDQDIKNRGLKLSDMAKAIPNELTNLQEYKSWYGFLRNIILAIINSYLLTLLVWKWDYTLIYNIPLAAIGIYLQGVILSGLFVLAHDCGHYCFSKNRLANEVIGVICLAPLWANFYSWIVGHNHHHKYSNVKKVETNWAEEMKDQDEYAQLSPMKKREYISSYGGMLGLLLGNIIAMTKYMKMPGSYPQLGTISKSMIKKIKITNYIVVSLTFITIYLLYKYTGLSGLLLIYIFPFMVGSVIGSLFTYTQHVHPDGLIFSKDGYTPIRSQIVTTYDVRFPKHMEWLTFNINFHLVHHITPSIPWYNTIEATEKFKEVYPDYHQEFHFNIPYLLKCWKNCVLDFDEKINAYRMSPPRS